jgi:hypothetical protein
MEDVSGESHRPRSRASKSGFILWSLMPTQIHTGATFTNRQMIPEKEEEELETKIEPQNAELKGPKTRKRHITMTMWA